MNRRLVDRCYEAWLAALARSNATVAAKRAEELRWYLSHGREPNWSWDAKASFMAWCAGTALGEPRES